MESILNSHWFNTTELNRQVDLLTLDRERTHILASQLLKQANLRKDASFGRMDRYKDDTREEGEKKSSPFSELSPAARQEIRAAPSGEITRLTEQYHLSRDQVYQLRRKR